MNHSGLSGRLVATVVVAMFGLAAPLASGCKPLYGGAPEKLKKPKPKKPPETAATAPAGPVYVEECKADFFEDNAKVRRKIGESTTLTGTGEGLLAQSAGAPPESRGGMIVDAISKLKGALSQDPYNATATFDMAVAYASINYKGCAIALLKRLAELEKHPDFERDATRLIKRAQNEPVFNGFRKDADAAMGR
jgi:hypothetical protein